MTQTQATEVEQTASLDTSGLEALAQISLVEIEEGVLKPWYMSEDVPPVDADDAEWEAFISDILEDYPESQRAALREEIENYRKKQLAALESDLPDIQPGGEGEQVVDQLAKRRVAAVFQ